MSNVITTNDGRPVEVQVTTVLVSERAAMPLVTSLAYGETHVSEMINKAMYGIISPGIYSGYTPQPGAGLNLSIMADADDPFINGVAIVNINGVQLRVFQQLDISVLLTKNIVNAVILRGNYEYGVLTNQVDSTSDINPADVLVVAVDDIEDGDVTLCYVDLTDGATQVTEDHINLRVRTTSNLDVYAHELKEDAHPAYTDAIADLYEITQTLGDDKVAKADISSSVTSSSTETVASSNGLKTAYTLAASKISEAYGNTVYMRMDTYVRKTNGGFTFDDGVRLYYGTDNDVHNFHDGSNMYTQYYTGNHYMQYENETKFAFTLNTGIFLATGNIGITSDARLKSNLRRLKNPMKDIRKAIGYIFKRIDLDDDDIDYIGFLAQQLLEIRPECVTYNPDNDSYVVHYPIVTAWLLEGLKEIDVKQSKHAKDIGILKRKNISLSKQIIAMQAEMDSMRADIKSLLKQK